MIPVRDSQSAHVVFKRLNETNVETTFRTLNESLGFL